VNAASLAGDSTGAADDAWLGSGAARIPVAVRLASPSPQDPQFAELVVTSGNAQGNRLVLLEIIDDLAILGPVDPDLLAQLQVGDRVEIDNSGFLAIQTYHRHQVPGPDYPVWDQFRNPDGTPRYPQRPLLVGPIFAGAVAGNVQRGTFTGRMIVVENLLDREAYPWQADWYRRKAAEHHGADLDDRFRLWLVESAIHADSELQEHPNHTVSYLGVLHQALRDIAAWVEDGVEPAPTSTYRVEDGQIIVPQSAHDRRGVQPTVTLTVDHDESVEVEIGAPVTLRATADTPDAGRVVIVDWDDHGTGSYDRTVLSNPEAAVHAERTLSFDRPGTYFPTVRVAAERNGDAQASFTRLWNLARVRVVVH
jgi:hypothetical protein